MNMSEWKTCPRCQCCNLNREKCEECRRTLADVEADKPKSELAPVGGDKPYAISGQRLTTMISCAHRLLRSRYRGSPLWALVSDLTGHGSTISAEICQQAGYDPCQPCGSKMLKRPIHNTTGSSPGR